MKIKYIVGSALEPQMDRTSIIAHCCNDVGGFGSGFAGAVNSKWISPRKLYKQAFKKGKIELGKVQLVQVASNIYVANMIAQHDHATGTGDYGKQYVQYDKLEDCLNRVAELANEYHAAVHMPRIGAGLAGGDWQKIEEIIAKTLSYNDVPTYIYTLPSEIDLF